MPHGSLTVTEAKIVRWLKKIGATIAKDEVIAEVETDKAVLEIEAPAAGQLLEIRAKVGTTVGMGEILGMIRRV